MLRYEVAGFDQLSLRQKTLIYYLSEATLAGRDILWDQNCRYNLPIRHMLEAAYRHLLTSAPSPAQDTNQREALTEYLKRVWFANGIHHHYGMDKFHPGFSEGFLRQVLTEVGYPIDEELMRVIFDPDVLPKRVNQNPGDDLLLTSAMNYYAPGITQHEAEDFYARLKQAADNSDPSRPPMYGLNSRLERDAEGHLYENTYKSGGLYGPAIDRITHWLRLAHEVAENDRQKQVIRLLIAFYETGDLHVFDRYTIEWVHETEGEVDFTNGFTEVYGDPLGLKASWEGYVNIRDHEATRRTELLSQNAQWFEDHSPIDPRFRKRECRGVSAKVIRAVMLGGDLYPASAIGINLPNSNWVRQEHGSKSVTIGNLTQAYARAARGNGFREEFYHPEALAEFSRNPDLDELLDDLHTDLHECLGHGSGQLLPGVDADALGVYGSTIEEARADLFALYYIADPKLVELGLTPSADAYRGQYYSYMLNGLMTQLVRIRPGHQIEEAHMRNRALIAHWLLEHCPDAMELRTLSQSHNKEGEPAAGGTPPPLRGEVGRGVFLYISDYPALRQGIARLLAEVQRIKSEGDQEGARQLVEQYGVRVNPELHAEVLRRYERLNLAPYKGFINPRLTPVRDADGHITDVIISYDETYEQQMLRYGQEYTL
ncbi:MAG: dihydrofolate reductase [Bacteroidaceae bacterium]|nr:dihydrofolate reductase [Bacteroidaceae bacterium]